MKDRRRVLEVNWSSVDKVDVYFHREEDFRVVKKRVINNQMFSIKDYSKGEDRHLPRTSSTAVILN